MKSSLPVHPLDEPAQLGRPSVPVNKMHVKWRRRCEIGFGRCLKLFFKPWAPRISYCHKICMEIENLFILNVQKNSYLFECTVHLGKDELMIIYGFYGFLKHKWRKKLMLKKPALPHYKKNAVSEQFLSCFNRSNL